MSESKNTPATDLAQPRAESRYIKCTIDNKTDSYFTVVDYDLKHGKWNNNDTPSNILPNTDKVNFYASGRSNTPSGTEGTIEWQADLHDAQLTMYFNCPYGPNASKFDVKIVGPGASFYNVKQEDFHPENKGHKPTVTITKMN